MAKNVMKKGARKKLPPRGCQLRNTDITVKTRTKFQSRKWQGSNCHEGSGQPKNVIGKLARNKLPSKMWISYNFQFGKFEIGIKEVANLKLTSRKWQIGNCYQVVNPKLA